MAQWLWGCAAEPRDAGTIPTTVAALQWEAKSENARVAISERVKDPHRVEIIPGPSSTVCLVGNV